MSLDLHGIGPNALDVVVRPIDRLPNKGEAVLSEIAPAAAGARVTGALHLDGGPKRLAGDQMADILQRFQGYGLDRRGR